MATDLELAYKTLKAKAINLSKYFGYYDGDQPLLYTAKRLEEIFKGVDAVFVENWCSVVIDAVKDRINLRTVQTPNPEAWSEIWEGSELALESDDVHEAALVAGESFLITWPDEDGTAQAYYNDPRLCHVWYQAENPRLKRFAAKWWVTDEGTMQMTLYYPDRLEYYETKKKAENVTAATAFEPMGDSAANPYNEIPVWHFRTGSRRMAMSDLKNVIPIQNGINKLLTDMMVAAEYGAFKQRYVISNADALGKLKNAPNEVWSIPAGDGIGQQTMVGQFDVTPLKNYLDAIDNMAGSLSTITRTPKHYFFSIGSNLSGESLIAMEAPLNKKAQDRIDRFAPEWQKAAAFLLRIAGVNANTEEVMPVFDKPSMIQPRTEAETIKMQVDAGMALVTALRKNGWSDEDIAQMQRDKQAERSAEQTNLAQVLLEAERRFNQGGASGSSTAPSTALRSAQGEENA